MACDYHVASDAVVIRDVFRKKTEATPKGVLDACQHNASPHIEERLRREDDESQQADAVGASRVARR